MLLVRFDMMHKHLSALARYFYLILHLPFSILPCSTPKSSYGTYARAVSSPKYGMGTAPAEIKSGAFQMLKQASSENDL